MRRDEADRGALLPLLALLVLAAAAFAGMLLFQQATRAAPHAVDEAILLSLRSPGNPADPIGPAWLEEAARDITSLGSNTVLGLGGLCLTALFAVQGRRREALVVLAAVGGAIIVANGLKLAFDRPRPDLVPHATRIFTSSFPSAHATAAAMVYLTLGALYARSLPQPAARAAVMAIAIVLTLLIGVSRIYLGVHWPSDVVAGWNAGAAWALAWRAFAR